ncbi:MAG: dihydrolipoyl dehydrogenase [Verrucomicrobia bacterium]|nr:MAG: dihydrolipoyl dehydrogenase [Verrucomicrobiota bacterium]
MSSNSYDLLVIGAGPGGYVAAIRAAQLGLTTALIDKRKTLGGTCLNIGCIPSKALLHLSEQYHFTNHEAASAGIKTGKVGLDLSKMMKRKDLVVTGLVKGVGMLVSKRGITCIQGTARLSGPTSVIVTTDKGNEEINATHIILAAGSVPVELPPLPFDGETIVSSDEALSFDRVPEKLVVVGAGAIGLELGSVWSRLGSDVTVVELLPRAAAGFDDDVCKGLERALRRQGLKLELSTRVTGYKKGANRRQAILQAEKDGKRLEFPADKILVAVGRRPFTEGLGLEEVGVTLDEAGRVRTDEHLQTSVKSIHAIGDIVAGPMLAHKGEEEGTAVAEALAGHAGHVNYDVIPNVIYTEPEVAGVGLTESQARERGQAISVGKFPLAANGRALATGSTDGFAKVIADKDSDRILGVQILGRNASELIAEAVAHMEYGGSAEDLARTVHAHPTLSEALKEAGLAVSKRSIHSL